MLDEIFEYMKTQAPREGCAIVIGDKWFPIENMSLEDDGFEMNSADYIRHVINGGEPTAIVHSHVNQENFELSPHDKSASEALAIPYWVVEVPSGKWIKYNE